jgi:protein phosphatase
MRTLIISDVHANLAAVTVLPVVDCIICAGDSVVYGPDPGPVIDRLIQCGARCVRGDEDDAVANGALHVAPPGLEGAAIETRAWTRSVLHTLQLGWLSQLPPELELEVDGHKLAVTHAYPGDDERYLGPTDDELKRTARAFPRATLVVLGHTHRQGIWYEGDTTILMPGSVGQSERGGYASFAMLERGAITLHNLPYELGRTVRQIKSTPWSGATKAACVRALSAGATRPYERVPLQKGVHRTGGSVPPATAAR